MQRRVMFCAVGLAVLTGQAGAIAGQAQSASLRPAGPAQVAGMRVLAGSLHDHSTDSDGDTASADIAKWEFDHRQEMGLDFGILTDHSDGFPAALGAPTSSNPWVRQGDLTRRYSRDGFAMLRGFELTNDQENHLNVIGSSNFVTRFQVAEGGLSMVPFYQWISTPPVADPSGNGLGYGGADGIGQFNHPGSKGALNWDDYAYNPAAAPVMSSIEIFGDQDRRSPGHTDAGWYWFALTQGWRLGPVMDWDFHHWTSDGIVSDPAPGASCGTAHHLPCQRSLLLAPASTPAGLIDALRHRRTGATERPDLWATLRGSGGEWQGSYVGGRPGETLRLTVDAGSTSDTLTSIDIVSDAGISPYPYYYGDNEPCRADPNATPTDLVSGCLGTGQLSLSYVEQHRRYLASGGHSTKKAQIDTPPAGTTIATVSVPPSASARTEQTVTVVVPRTPSTRADGAHFFYAVAHTAAARSWTAPILTDPSRSAVSAAAEGTSGGGAGLPNTRRSLPVAALVGLLAFIPALLLLLSRTRRSTPR